MTAKPQANRSGERSAPQRSFGLDGRTAVITGAASGIGAATAIAMARAGARVVLGWKPSDKHDVTTVIDEISRHGGSAVSASVDVRDTASVDAFFSAAQDAFSSVDIVLANAGIARSRAVRDLTDGELQELLDVDLLGVFRCFRSALRLDSAPARLLATSSIAGPVTGWAEHVHYSAAKAGIVGLVRSLALEVASTGITVNAVAPGVIVTPQSLDAENSLGPAGLAALEARTPLGRHGTPADVAAMFVFLASDEASYVTGQTIVVDGGVTLSYS